MATCPSSFIVVFLLLVLAFAFSAHGGPALVPEEVRDLTGKKLISGVDYFILPAIEGREGGVGLGPNRKNSCPFDVIQEDYDFWTGIPVKFLPVNLKKGMIRVSTDLNIKFNKESTDCDQTTVWSLRSFDKEVRQYFVTTDGSVGDPGPQTLSNWFKIEKYDNAYKLSYCPSVCKFCKVICKDIGIYVDDKRVRRLALSKTPFKVMFKKA